MKILYLNIFLINFVNLSFFQVKYQEVVFRLTEDIKRGN